MNDLHKNQALLLELLADNKDFPLTIREIQNKLDFSSSSVVAHHMQKLEQKGYLKRNPHNPRDYQVYFKPEKSVVTLNLYGFAQCGRNGTILDGNPIDKIPLASKILKFQADLGFIVKAKGDSMEPKIMEGDLVISEKSNVAENGDIIVCVYNDEVLIKKFFKQNEHISLISINSEKHTPIYVTEYFKIEGIVRNIINYS